MSPSSKNGLNTWSNNATKKIEINDFYFNMRDVQWKGQTANVEYDLFTMLIKQWIGDGMTKEEALDLFFDCL